eukprot:jgi/Hompol1/5309/HPOL_004317-RA
MTPKLSKQPYSIAHIAHIAHIAQPLCRLRFITLRADPGADPDPGADKPGAALSIYTHWDIWHFNIT